MQSTIEWTGTFDSAHFIPGHPKCGRLHGHTYTVKVILCGQLDKTRAPGYLVDYGEIKRIVGELDHRLLVPTNQASRVSFDVKAGYAHIGYGPTGEGEVFIRLPKDQVAALPEAPESSAEWIAQTLVDRFEAQFPNLEMIQVEVSETPKTKAVAFRFPVKVELAS